MPTLDEYIASQRTAGKTTDDIKAELEKVYGMPAKELAPFRGHDVTKIAAAAKEAGSYQNAFKATPSPTPFVGQTDASSRDYQPTFKAAPAELAHALRTTAKLHSDEEMAKRRALETQQQAKRPSMEDTGTASSEEAQLRAAEPEENPANPQRYTWNPITKAGAAGIGLAASPFSSSKNAENFGGAKEGYEDAEKTVKEGLEKDHPVVRTLKGVGNLLAALPEITSELVLPDTVPADYTPEQAEAESAARGVEFGGKVGQGVVGGTAHMLRHPWDTFQYDPVGTVAQGLPAFGALGKAGKLAKVAAKSERVAPILAKIGESPVGRAAESVSNKVSQAGDFAKTHTIDALAEKSPKIAKAMDYIKGKLTEQPTAYLALKRILSDAIDVGDARANALLEHIIFDPEAVVSQVKSQGKRAANQIRKGGMGKQAGVPISNPVTTLHDLSGKGEKAPHLATGITAEPATEIQGRSRPVDYDESALERRSLGQDILDSNPTLKGIVSEMEKSLDEVAMPASQRGVGADFFRDRVRMQDALADVFTEHSGALLHDPSFRKVVIKKAVSLLGEQGVPSSKELISQINSAIEDAIKTGQEMGSGPADAVLRFGGSTTKNPGGRALKLSDVIAQALRPKDLQEIRAAAVERIASDAAEAAHKVALESGVAQEHQKWVPDTPENPTPDSKAWVTGHEAQDRVAKSSEPLPSAVTPQVEAKWNRWQEKVAEHAEYRKKFDAWRAEVAKAAKEEYDRRVAEISKPEPAVVPHRNFGRPNPSGKPSLFPRTEGLTWAEELAKEKAAAAEAHAATLERIAKREEKAKATHAEETSQLDAAKPARDKSLAARLRENENEVKSLKDKLHDDESLRKDLVEERKNAFADPDEVAAIDKDIARLDHAIEQGKGKIRIAESKPAYIKQDAQDAVQALKDRIDKKRNEVLTDTNNDRTIFEEQHKGNLKKIEEDFKRVEGEHRAKQQAKLDDLPNEYDVFAETARKREWVAKRPEGVPEPDMSKKPPSPKEVEAMASFDPERKAMEKSNRQDRMQAVMDQSAVEDLSAQAGTVPEATKVAPMTNMSQEKLAQHIVDTARKEGRNPLLLPSSVDPQALAETMRKMHTPQAKDWRLGGPGLAEAGTEAGAASEAAAAHKLADYLDRFTELDPRKHGVGGWAEPLTAESLGWHHQARNALKDLSQNLMQTMARGMKSGLTARNPVSMINNVMSNVGLQMVRTGDPTVAARIFSDMHEWGSWVKDAESVSPEMQRFHKAVEATGMMDTDLVPQDLGVGKGTGISGLLDKVYEKSGLEKMYRMGDQMFKLEETKRNWGTINDYFGKLKDGEHIKLELTPRESAILTKKPNGIYEVETTSGKKFNLKEGSPEFDKLVAKAASKPAQDLFFDFSDVSGLAKILKSSKVGFSFKSIFYTWLAKAVDIPGLKKGLGARALGADNLNIVTNSKAILKSQIAEGMMRSARKTIAVQGLTHAMDNDDLRKAFRFSPADDRNDVVRVLSDPNYIESASFGPWNFAKPSLQLFKLLTTAYYRGDSLKDGNEDLSEIKDPKERQDTAKRRQLLAMVDSGQLASESDLTDLIGLAGDPISDMWKKMREAQEGGKEVTKDDVWQAFGAAMIGGAAKNAAEVALSHGTDEEQMREHTPYGKSIHPDMLPKDQLAWAVRKFTGLGWQGKTVPELLKSFKGYEMEWNKSLKIQQRLKSGEDAVVQAEGAQKFYKNNPERKKQADETYRKAMLDLQDVHTQKAIIHGEIMKMKLKLMNTIQTLTGQAVEDPDPEPTEPQEPEPKSVEPAEDLPEDDTQEGSSNP